MYHSPSRIVPMPQSAQTETISGQVTVIAAPWGSVAVVGGESQARQMPSSAIRFSIQGSSHSRCRRMDPPSPKATRLTPGRLQNAHGSPESGPLGAHGSAAGSLCASPFPPFRLGHSDGSPSLLGFLHFRLGLTSAAESESESSEVLISSRSVRPSESEPPSGGR